MHTNRVSCQCVPIPAHMFDAADYRTKLVTRLTQTWNLACPCITKAQKVQYDKHAKPRISDRVIIYVPHEMSGKDQKLSLPYHVPYRITDIHSSCVSVKPVYKPDDKTHFSQYGSNSTMSQRST